MTGISDEYGIGFSAQAHASGLQACVEAIEVWVWDEVDLPGFLSGLAQDFRGWTGARSWRTNHLTLQTVYHSRNHVALTWTLRPWITRPESWEASITTWLEAGALMSDLADQMQLFLPKPKPPTAMNP